MTLGTSNTYLQIMQAVHISMVRESYEKVGLGFELEVDIPVRQGLSIMESARRDWRLFLLSLTLWLRSVPVLKAFCTMKIKKKRVSTMNNWVLKTKVLNSSTKPTILREGGV